MSYLRSLSVSLVCFGLVACGGGGGGSSGTPPVQQPSSPQSSSQQSSVGQSSSSPTVAITRKTAPAVAGAVVDTLELAVNLPFELNEELNLYFTLPDATQTVKCDNAKGSAKVKVSNSGRLIEEHYEACQLDETEISGDRSIEVDSSDSVTGAKINYTFKQLTIGTLNKPLGKTSLNGIISYRGKASSYGDSDRNFNVDFDLTIDDARDGRLEIKNFKMQAEYNPYGKATDLHENLMRMQSISGNFVLNNTHFSLESAAQGVLLKGDNNSRVRLTRDQNFNAYVSWDETGDGLADANLVLPYKEDFSITDMIADGDHKTSILVARNWVSQIYEGAQVYMARGGVADVYVHPNFTNSSAALLTYELNGKVTNGTEWTQVEAGYFKFSFPANSVDTNYDLTFTAVDDQGNRSPEIHAKIYVGTDTDKDSIPDASDDDDDGDWTRDIHDAFPLDPKESKDSDGDGIGDNTDPDEDFSVQRGSIWFVDKDGIVYFTSNLRTDDAEHVQKRFSKRWDPKTNKFLSELTLHYFGGGRSYYSLAQNRLYYTSSTNDIYYVDLATMQETLFVKGGAFLQIVDIAWVKSNIVLVSRTTNIGTTYESYNDKGQLVSSIEGYDSMRNSISFYPADVGAFCSAYVNFDLQGNLYQRAGSTSYRCSYSTIKISLDGRYVYREGGTMNVPEGIYTIEGNLIAGNNINSLLWLSSGLLVRDDKGLVLYNTQGTVIKRYSLPEGTTIKTIFSNDNRLVLSLQLADYTLKIIVLDTNLEFVSQYLPTRN